jgi:hypothetical protein
MKYGLPYMALMRTDHHTFLWWKWETSTEVCDKYMVGGLNENSMIEAAYDILKTMREQKDKAYLLGDYPPKSIAKDDTFDKD